MGAPLWNALSGHHSDQRVSAPHMRMCRYLRAGADVVATYMEAARLLIGSPSRVLGFPEAVEAVLGAVPGVVAGEALVAVALQYSAAVPC